MSSVVVVGGGISGLTTALTLADNGLDVTLLEAGDRLGGTIRTSPFAGLPAVDEGADAFLARMPAATALAHRVGLGDDLTAPTAARAAVWRNGLHAIPDGVVLGVPADLVALARTRLLSPRGKARAAIEPLLPRRRDPGDALGRLVRSRFGDEVQVHLVDALVGSIYGADTDRFSLAAVPQLAALAEHRSLLLGARRVRAAGPPTDAPLFLTPRAGMGALVDAVADAAVMAGVRIELGTAVDELDRDGARWRVGDRSADAVVLATPAAATAPLLSAAAPDAARRLAVMDHAGVVIVTLAVEDWPDRLHGRSGYLVPKPLQRTVTAASFGSQKWAHWRPQDGGEVLRISLGRDGLDVGHLEDDELLERAVVEVGHHVGVDLQPTATRVSRWPAAFPQYRPHHLDWVADVERALPSGLFVTGASYRGIGIPACIAQASATAQRIQDTIA